MNLRKVKFMKKILMTLLFLMASSSWAGACKDYLGRLANDQHQSAERRQGGKRLYDLITNAEACKGGELSNLLGILNAERLPEKGINPATLCQQILAVDARPYDCSSESSLRAFYNIFRARNLTKQQEAKICDAERGLKIEYSDQIAQMIRPELTKISGFQFTSGGIETPERADSCPEVEVAVSSQSDISRFRSIFGDRINGAKVFYNAVGEAVGF